MAKGAGNPWALAKVPVIQPQFQKSAAGGVGKGQVKGGGKDDGLNAIDPALKVWVGGLAPGVTWKELQNHFREAGRVIWSEVLPKGIGCVAFKTQAQAASAIASHDGSELGGQAIQVDTWDKKPPKKGAGAKGGPPSPGKGGKGPAAAAGFGPAAGKGNGVVATKGAGMGMGMGMAMGGMMGKGGMMAKGDLMMAKGGMMMAKGGINDIDPQRKVWVGGLAEGVTWNELQKHFKEAGKTTWAEVLPKGVGCVAFKTAAQAEKAIGLLNGSELGGQPIEVDAWANKSPAAGKAGRPVLKTGFLKKKQAGGKAAGKGRNSSAINKVEPELKVWVGGLPEGVTREELKEHFKDAGEVHLSEVLPRGQGCVAFKTPSDAETAILVFNASELKGNVIEVDTWEKKPKVAKEAKEESKE